MDKIPFYIQTNNYYYIKIQNITKQNKRLCIIKLLILIIVLYGVRRHYRPLISEVTLRGSLNMGPATYRGSVEDNAIRLRRIL